jgi:hypothetical protein
MGGGDNYPDLQIHSQLPDLQIDSQLPDLQIHSQLPESAFRATKSREFLRAVVDMGR